MRHGVLAVDRALVMAFAMLWEILWALILGFVLSAAVQAVVSKKQMSRLLPDDSPRSLAIACALGAASSSCSYAAVALARSLFRKGANFTAAMAFEFASTNLVIELGIIMVFLLGWRFAVAEFVGGLLMIIILTLLFKAFLTRPMVEQARRQVDRGVLGRMEGHAEMDMSVTEGPLIRRVASAKGFTAISHYFVMDWAAVWTDVAGGLLLAGILAAWVPAWVWQGFFLVRHELVAKVWGPLVGPIVAMLSFVCSIGNVPLAAVLWNGGISFGGVISFVFADLIVLPVLNIYRKYYGGRMTMFLLATSYTAMVIAGLIIEFAFQALDLAPRQRTGVVMEPHVTLNYTTILNILFLALAAILMTRFMKTGGPHMLRMMNKPAPDRHQHAA
ncbi:MAG: hypothetical protein DME17_00640 [Candidatus Rokuibacteriota bacterium]|nr:MAG: hypothetical protein DME17_00640 [Candidatus Rokubacteria bacterium]